MRTLTVAGTPPPYRMGAEARVPALIEAFEQQGVEHWARQSMAGRLGCSAVVHMPNAWRPACWRFSPMWSSTAELDASIFPDWGQCTRPTSYHQIDG